MRTIIRGVAGVACLALCAVGAMGSITLQDSYGSTGGGEFIATPSGFVSLHSLDGLAPKFQTFCVEVNENINFGTSYNVVIGTDAIQGGVGGGSPDPLDGSTAWLYCEFIKGTLTGYNYTPGQGRIDSADALQTAIWLIENEITKSDARWTGLSSSIQTAADGFVTLAAGKSSSCTYVMNLWEWVDGKKVDRQSLLVCIPAPAAVVLGMLGLGLVGWAKRRLA